MSRDLPGRPIIDFYNQPLAGDCAAEALADVYDVDEWRSYGLGLPVKLPTRQEMIRAKVRSAVNRRLVLTREEYAEYIRVPEPDPPIMSGYGNAEAEAFDPADYFSRRAAKLFVVDPSESFQVP